jgi:hypothetical protein
MSKHISPTREGNKREHSEESKWSCRRGEPKGKGAVVRENRLRAVIRGKGESEETTRKSKWKLRSEGIDKDRTERKGKRHG